MKPWYWEVCPGNGLAGARTGYELLRTLGAAALREGRRSETLKVAFRGEINALRSALAADSRAAVAAGNTETQSKTTSWPIHAESTRHTPPRSVIYERAS